MYLSRKKNRSVNKRSRAVFMMLAMLLFAGISLALCPDGYAVTSPAVPSDGDVIQSASDTEPVPVPSGADLFGYAPDDTPQIPDTVKPDSARSPSPSEAQTSGTDVSPTAAEVSGADLPPSGSDVPDVPDEPDEPDVPDEPKSISVVRMGGADRFETAALIARGEWTSSETVFLANAFSYADALTGAPLAYAYDAPVLLTAANKLSGVTADTIKALSARRVYILGGTAAVSKDIEDSLVRDGYDVRRIWGDTRYSTAAAAARALAGKAGASKEIFIASGANYPDALSASSAAAVKGCPILYFPANGNPDKDTLEYIKKGGFDTAYILGGQAAVGSAAETALSKAGIKSVERIGGSDRYYTSLLISMRFSSVLDGRDVAFATGRNFPDALAGSVLAAKRRVPVLLTDNTLANDNAKSYIFDRGSLIFYVFGSQSVVSDSILEKHMYLINGITEVPEATYLGVKGYNTSEAARINMPSVKYRFRVNGTEKLYTMYNGALRPDGVYEYPIQNTLKVGSRYSLKLRGSKVIEASEIVEALEYTPPVSGTAGERTVGNFLRVSMEPVGTCLYIYGGGWDWDGTASSIQSRTIGVSPDWVRFFRSQNKNFTYRDKDGKSSNKNAPTSYYPYGGINQYYYAGLDCSGYAAWAVYNTLNTESGRNGYVMGATKMAKQFAALGLGTYSKDVPKPDGTPATACRPGDIYSISGHIWISLGTCSDGSVVMLHSTPSDSRSGQPGGGVQIGAIGTSKNCEAYKLADKYMSEFYPEWYKRYPVSLKSPGLYLSFSGDNPGRFRWSVLSDPEKFSEKSAAETLKALFGK